MNNNQIEFLKKYNVNVEEGIKNTMDSATYKEILEDYFKDLPDEINKLNNYKYNNDLANYAITVHALKSNSRCLGFTEFGETCYQHEMESKANNMNFINTNFENLVKESQKVYAIIKAYKEVL